MDGFFKKANQKVNLGRRQMLPTCPSDITFLKGWFLKNLSKNSMWCPMFILATSSKTVAYMNSKG